MGHHQQGSAGSFVRPPRFNSDQTVFDDIHPAHAIGRGDFVELVEKRHGARNFAVHRDRRSSFKTNLDRSWFFRSLFRGHHPLPHRFVRSIRWIFEHAAFVAQVPDVAIPAVNIFLGLLDRNIVVLRVSDGFFARDDVPFAPRSDNFQLGSQRLGGQLEPHLIVALSGASVGYGIGAKLLGQLNLTLRQQRTGERSSQQIFVFVYRAGAQRGPDILGNEFFAKIFDICRTGSGGQSFLARGFQIFLLPQIADHGDDFAAIVVFLQPGNNDGGIQTSGIGQHNFLRQRHISSNGYGDSDLLRENESTAAQLIEQRQQNRFLHVQAIFGLLENDRTRRIHNVSRDLSATMGGEAVHEDCVGSGVRKQRVVYLVGGKSLGARGRFLFLAHAGPNVGVNRLHLGHCFFRGVQDFNLSAGLASRALGLGDHRRGGLIARRRGHTDVSAVASANA